jgi:hypothetical protein
MAINLVWICKRMWTLPVLCIPELTPYQNNCRLTQPGRHFTSASYTSEPRFITQLSNTTILLLLLLLLLNSAYLKNAFVNEAASRSTASPLTVHSTLFPAVLLMSKGPAGNTFTLLFAGRYLAKAVFLFACFADAAQ